MRLRLNANLTTSCFGYSTITETCNTAVRWRTLAIAMACIRSDRWHGLKNCRGTAGAGTLSRVNRNSRGWSGTCPIAVCGRWGNWLRISRCRVWIGWICRCSKRRRNHDGTAAWAIVGHRRGGSRSNQIAISRSNRHWSGDTDRSRRQRTCSIIGGWWWRVVPVRSCVLIANALFNLPVEREKWDDDQIL